MSALEDEDMQVKLRLTRIEDELQETKELLRKTHSLVLFMVYVIVGLLLFFGFLLLAPSLLLPVMIVSVPMLCFYGAIRLFAAYVDHPEKVEATFPSH